MSTHPAEVGVPAEVPPVASLMQDPRTVGGVGTVNSWYRRWMIQHRPGESQEIYLDETSNSRSFFQRAIRGTLFDLPVPRMLPVLHVPPLLAGRALARRRLETVAEAHIIGGVAIHGHLAAGRVPTLIWLGTTIGDERRATLSARDPARRVLHSTTLPPLQFLEARVLKSATKVLAQSPHTAAQVRNMGIDKECVEVVPVPIDTDNFRPNDSQRHGILFVGRVHDVRKNFAAAVSLLESSKLVRDENLHVVSSVDPTPQVPPHLRSSIRWHGRIHDISQVYRSCKLLIMTSLQEGLGIAVFESLASGTPAIILRCGGPDDFLRQSGGGEVHEDLTALKESVERHLSDPTLLLDRAITGRAWVCREMSSKAFLSDPDLFRL